MSVIACMVNNCDYVITPELTVKLKHPFGELFDSIEAALSYVNDCFRWEKHRIICVGDVVSKNILKYVKPHIIIIDGKTRRDNGIVFDFDKVYKHWIEINNPAGTIQREAWHGIKNALEYGECGIRVNGEEDLLLICAGILSPIGTVFLYGQPGEGVVVFQMSNQIRQKLLDILMEFDTL